MLSARGLDASDLTAKYLLNLDSEEKKVLTDGKTVFYSLGNFIFDTNYQRAHLYSDEGVLLKLIFTFGPFSCPKKDQASNKYLYNPSTASKYRGEFSFMKARISGTS